MRFKVGDTVASNNLDGLSSDGAIVAIVEGHYVVKTSSDTFTVLAENEVFAPEEIQDRNEARRIWRKIAEKFEASNSHYYFPLTLAQACAIKAIIEEGE